MIDFVGRTTSVVDEAAKWGEYFGGVDTRAQQRWVNRELRNRTDEANRRELALSSSDAEAYRQQAGLFVDANGQLRNMGRRNVPRVTGTGANAIGGQGPVNLRPDQESTAPVSEPNSSINASTSGLGRPLVYGLRDGTSTYGPYSDGYRAPGVRETEPVRISELTDAQRRAWHEYLRATRTNIRAQAVSPNLRVSTQRPGVDEAQARDALREHGLDIDNGRLVRIRSPYDIDTEGLNTLNNVPDGSIPTVDAHADLLAQDDTSTASGQPRNAALGGLFDSNEPNVADDPLYSGDPDTSGELQPTPEMRLIEATTQNALRRAQVLAQHGDSTRAAQEFANALQGQAALIHQNRLLMLRAASQGHRTALADLLGIYSGRPPGTTRIAETGERENRFRLEVFNGTDWVPGPGRPMTHAEMFNQAEYLVNAEAVIARSAANAEIIRANIAAGAQIRVAAINALSAQERMYVDAAIADASNRTRERIAQGDAELTIDSTNNRAYISYWETRPDGQVEHITEEITIRNVRVPDTNGQRTEEQSVRRRITGVNGAAGLDTN